MKKYVLLLALCISMMLKTVSAENSKIQYLQMEATAYCCGTLTADGSRVRTGIAAAHPEWIGKTALIYEDIGGQPGDYIGIFEVKDTGGDRRIKAGKCIDIYNPSYEWCIQFGRKNVIVILVDGKG